MQLRQFYVIIETNDTKQKNMDYTEISNRQLDKANFVVNSTMGNLACVSALSKSYNFVSDISTCIDAIAKKREVKLLKYAVKEYQFALFSVNQGFYRQAFSTLRLSFELLLSAIEFSANELSLRQWEVGAKDIVWSRIVDPDSGVFSKTFIRAFCPSLDERANHYRALSERVYRECSEFVHGNAHTHVSLPTEFTFSEFAALAWAEKSTTIHLISLFAFFLRYGQELDESERRKLESIFLENLGHLQPVRLIFGAPV